MSTLGNSEQKGYGKGCNGQTDSSLFASVYIVLQRVYYSAARREQSIGLPLTYEQSDLAPSNLSEKIFAGTTFRLSELLDGRNAA